MTTRNDYLLAAQTLIGSCREAAIRSLPEQARDRADRILRGRPRRDVEALTEGAGDLLLRRGAGLAAHLVQARVHAVGLDEDDEGGSSVVLQAAAEALAEHDVTVRLGAAREVSALAAGGGWAALVLRDRATLLAARSWDSAEGLAAAGHLCRRVLADYEDYRWWADTAYWARFGDRLLVPPAIARAAAIAHVVTGQQKTDVARRAGISRQTLDNWLRAEAER